MQYLKTSATFAMSRGGKELFHTNFLSYVLEMDARPLPQDAKNFVSTTQNKLLDLLFCQKDAASRVVRVLTWREKNNLDLIVLAAPKATPNDGAHDCMLSGEHILPTLNSVREIAADSDGKFDIVGVVIEAKLKALPTKEQLERYSKKLINGVDLPFAEAIEVTLARTKRRTKRARKKESNKVKEVQENDKENWGFARIRLLKVGERNALITAHSVLNSDDGDDPERKGQLIAGLCKAVRRILVLPTIADDSCSDTGWDTVLWKDIVEAFPSAVDGATDLTSQLLSEYRTSTSHLLQVLAKTRCAVLQWCAGEGESQETLGSVWGAVKHENFKNLRIHDLVGKYAYDIVRRELINEVNGEPAANDFKFHTYTFMTNATPGVGIELRKTIGVDRKERSVSIGVQIQGADYRHLLSASHPEKRKEEGLRKWALTLCDPSLCEPTNGAPVVTGWWKIGLNEPAREQDQVRDFKKYNANAFLYTSQDASALTFQNLKSAVQASMRQARKLCEDRQFAEHAKQMLESMKT